MAFAHFLAMTSAEFDSAPELPSAPAWMACHFSPYATGLSNLPEHLPKGSLLILNDRTPIGGHDPERIRQQLEAVITRFDCCGLLLDLQRPGIEESRVLAQELSAGLPCSVAVTPEYAPDGCTVFLPPIPVDQRPERYLAPWQGREIWLESALSSQCIVLSPSGANITGNRTVEAMTHSAPELFCHYRIETEPTQARFYLRRTREDLEALLEKVQALGITNAVGLYQELGRH